jgi:aldehyde:ferredoxin oxidoreductase
MGKLLFIDLSSGRHETRPLTDELAKGFLGGPGLGAKILYDEMPAHTDPFAPESVLGFVSGALNGTGALMAGRYTVVCKSPVTGGWNDANSGGTFGPRLKAAGYDAVFLKGVSPKPVYVFIDDGEVIIKDASAIWGKTTIETENAIKKEIGDNKLGIALIGPAGERKSRMAAVMNDTHRAAGRGGPGAVMGSKNLKALVVRGKKIPQIADKETQVAVNKEVVTWGKEGPIKEIVAGYSAHGTGVAYESCILCGDASVKNWTGAGIVDISEEDRKAVFAPVMDAKYKKKKYNCDSCHIGCGAMYSLEDDEYDLSDTGRPEYETVGMFCSQMLNADPVLLNRCNLLCNEYGFDTISAGGTVAWAMECYNEGILSKDELDGIELTWGNSDAILELTKKICKGEGVGLILQEGSQYAADHFGKGHSALVVASGMEIPQHDPRWSPGLARTYKYDPTPGRHVKGGIGIMYGALPPEVKYNFEDTGEKDLGGVISLEIVNSGGYCLFTSFCMPPGAQVRLINAVTGYNYSQEEANQLGKRMYIMRHAFNLREGMRRKDFKISDRIIGKPPLEKGPQTGVSIDVEKLADNFFASIGFKADGVPAKETLVEIGGLESVIKDLYPDR